MSNKNHLSNDEIDDLAKQFPVAKKEAIKDELLSEVKQWQNGVKRWLDKKNPFKEDQRRFRLADRSLKQKYASITDIEDDLSGFSLLSQKSQ